ncbi:hypothetical protein [Legionella yabuuchiae]|uniref:hypothetical protein n=1 Tax=Legionella yabuuchiae TaxID=376727 RepID=UPI001056BC15|nr:hypothetical protein [Legionella yabuuchiae]
MADQLKQDIQGFNQDVLMHELECAFYIRKELIRYLQSLGFDSNAPTYPKLIAMIDDNLKALLNTNNQETFQLALQRFNEFITKLISLRDSSTEPASFDDGQDPIGKVREYLKELSETRNTYLNKANNKRRLFLDAGWMSAGVGLIVAASVLAIAFPWLLVPGIVIGAAILGYGTVDFSKATAELYMESKYPELGERTLSEERKSKLQALEQEMKDFSVTSLIAEHQHQQNKERQEKRFFSRLGTGLSFTGLLLAFTSLAVIFVPVLAIPIVGVVLLAVASVATAIAAVSVLAAAHNKEKLLLKQAELEFEQATRNDEALISEVSQSLIPADNAAIILKKHSDEHLRETDYASSVTPIESNSSLSEVSSPTDEVESESEGDSDAEGDSDVETDIAEDGVSDRVDDESEDEEGDVSNASLKG